MMGRRDGAVAGRESEGWSSGRKLKGLTMEMRTDVNVTQILCCYNYIPCTTIQLVGKYLVSNTELAYCQSSSRIFLDSELKLHDENPHKNT
jgi:hypothetical protein